VYNYVVCMRNYRVGHGSGTGSSLFKPAMVAPCCSPTVIGRIHAERLRVSESGVQKAAQRGDMLAESEHFGGSILAQCDLRSATKA
jgi:hypothetical protein